MPEKSASAVSSDKSASAKSKGDAGKDARAKESQTSSAVKSETTGSGDHSSPKKRRKVNHGKLPSHPVNMRQGSGRCCADAGSLRDRVLCY